MSSPLRYLQIYEMKYLHTYEELDFISQRVYKKIDHDLLLKILFNKLLGAQIKLKLNEMKVLVTQLCLTLCHPGDCCPPASSVHGILQVRILEWTVIPFSRASS